MGSGWVGGVEEGRDLSTKRALFFGIYKFKFYPKTDFLNCHVFLCDLENEEKENKLWKKSKEKRKIGKM